MPRHPFLPDVYVLLNAQAPELFVYARGSTGRGVLGLPKRSLSPGSGVFVVGVIKDAGVRVCSRVTRWW